MAKAEAYREIVAARAGGVCEYCRLLEMATGVTFHIEHVVPQIEGGQTTIRNLALSCPGCNLAKGEKTTGRDGQDQIQRLFSPRQFEPWLLGWHLHFRMDADTGLILPRTPVAEATIAALKMNTSLRVFARRLQIISGLIG